MELTAKEIVDPVAALLGVLIGFALSFFADNWKRRIWGPKLSVGVDRGPGCVAATFYSTHGKPKGIYLRIEVKNSKSLTAEDVRLFLTRIDYSPPVDHTAPITSWTDTGFRDSLFLPWSSSQNGFSAYQIPFGPPFFADVMCSSEADRRLFPVWMPLNRYENLLSATGFYRFHVMATSKNGAVAAGKFIAAWSGDWKTLTWID